MDLRGAIQRTQGAAQQSMSPPCNPCTEASPDHGRCPTALGSEYLGVIDSNYRCPCYFSDVIGHRTSADERQEEHADARADAEHFGRYDWDTEGRDAFRSWSDEDKHDWYPGRYR